MWLYVYGIDANRVQRNSTSYNHRIPLSFLFGMANWQRSTGVPQGLVLGPLLIAVFLLRPFRAWLGFPYLYRSRDNPLFCQKALEVTTLSRALIVLFLSLSPSLAQILLHCLSEALHCLLVITHVFGSFRAVR